MKIFVVVLLFLAVNLAAGVAILPYEKLQKRFIGCGDPICGAQSAKRRGLGEKLKELPHGKLRKRYECETRVCGGQSAKRGLGENLKERSA